MRLTTIALGLHIIIVAVLLAVVRSSADGYSTLWVVISVHSDYDDNGFAQTHELRLHHVKTGIEHVITKGDGSIGFARVSPDGKWILYGTSQNINDHNVYFSLVDLRGELEYSSQLFDANTLRLGSLSPDGQWETFWNYGGSQPYVQSSNFRTIKPLSQTPIRRITPMGGIWNRFGMWTPDSQWYYFSGISSSSCSLRDHPRCELAIFRVNPDTQNPEIVVTLAASYLSAIDITHDWLLFATDNTIYRARPDGTQLQQVVVIPDGYTIWQFWSASNGDLMLITGENGGDWMIAERLHVDTLDREPLIRDSGFGTLNSYHVVEWSDDRQALTLIARNGDYFYWIVMNRDGEIKMSLPMTPCEDSFPFWNEDVAYVLDNGRGTHCRLLKYAINDEQPSIAQEYPEDAFNFSVLSTPEPNWIHYISDGKSFIVNVYGTESLQMRSRRGNPEAWIEIPNQSADTRLPIVMGIGCLCVALIGTWLFNRKFG